MFTERRLLRRGIEQQPPESSGEVPLSHQSNERLKQIGAQIDRTHSVELYLRKMAARTPREWKVYSNHPQNAVGEGFIYLVDGKGWFWRFAPASGMQYQRDGAWHRTEYYDANPEKLQIYVHHHARLSKASVSPKKPSDAPAFSRERREEVPAVPAALSEALASLQNSLRDSGSAVTWNPAGTADAMRVGINTGVVARAYTISYRRDSGFFAVEASGAATVLFRSASEMIRFLRTETERRIQEHQALRTLLSAVGKLPLGPNAEQRAELDAAVGVVRITLTVSGVQRVFVLRADASTATMKFSIQENGGGVGNSYNSIDDCIDGVRRLMTRSAEGMSVEQAKLRLKRELYVALNKRKRELVADEIFLRFEENNGDISVRFLLPGLREVDAGTISITGSSLAPPRLQYSGVRTENPTAADVVDAACARASVEKERRWKNVALQLESAATALNARYGYRGWKVTATVVPDQPITLVAVQNGTNKRASLTLKTLSGPVGDGVEFIVDLVNITPPPPLAGSGFSAVIGSAPFFTSPEGLLDSMAGMGTEASERLRSQNSDLERGEAQRVQEYARRRFQEVAAQVPSEYECERYEAIAFDIRQAAPRMTGVPHYELHVSSPEKKSVYTMRSQSGHILSPGVLSPEGADVSAQDITQDIVREFRLPAKADERRADGIMRAVPAAVRIPAAYTGFIRLSLDERRREITVLRKGMSVPAVETQEAAYRLDVVVRDGKPHFLLVDLRPGSAALEVTDTADIVKILNVPRVQSLVDVERHRMRNRQNIDRMRTEALQYVRRQFPGAPESTNASGDTTFTLGIRRCTIGSPRRSGSDDILYIPVRVDDGVGTPKACEFIATNNNGSLMQIFSVRGIWQMANMQENMKQMFE